MRQLLLVVGALVVSMSWACAARGQETPAAESAKPATTQAATSQAVVDADKALAARYRALAKEVAGGIAQQQLNLWPESQKASLDILDRKTPADEKTLADKRQWISDMVKLYEKARVWPKPVPLEFARAKGKITVDAKIDEAAWKNAKVYSTLYEMNEPGPFKTEPTTMRLLWDEKNLYFAFECTDSSINAPEIMRDGPVFDSDCVELFLMPSKRWGLYWEINYNASGSIFDALQCKDPNAWGFLGRPYETIEGMQTAYTLTGPKDAPTGFVIEIAVPVSELPCFTAKAGATLTMLATRVDPDMESVKGMDKPQRVVHWLAWTPMMVWYHNPAGWSTATLKD